MGELAHLHELLNSTYGMDAVTLAPLHLFDHAQRGVYRVNAPGQTPFVLRAYQQEKAAAGWLIGCADTLLYLQAENFPAPCVQHTKDGESVGHHDGWTALLLTYIAGEMSTGRAAELWALGAMLAQLHTLNISDATATCKVIPYCRWQPNTKIAHWLADLQQAADMVPHELLGLFAFAVDVLTQVVSWTQMPLALLHADPNPFNAVCMGPDRLVLIDWDGAGIGPAILDLGYLLLTAHIVLSAWPQIDADVALIEAIMQGYCSIRPLTEPERSALPIATCFNDAVWAAQAIPQVIGREWRANRTLHRFGARYPWLARIGRVAQQYCAT